MQEETHSIKRSSLSITMVGDFGDSRALPLDFISIPHAWMPNGKLKVNSFDVRLYCAIILCVDFILGNPCSML
jgi:hypothetical protein